MTEDLNGATEQQIQVVIRTELEPGTVGLQVRRADHSAMLPPISLFVKFPTTGANYEYVAVSAYAIAFPYPYALVKDSLHVRVHVRGNLCLKTQTPYFLTSSRSLR